MNRLIFTFAVLVSFTIKGFAFASELPNGVDVAEIQQFEQSYEIWIHQLVRHTIQADAETVLVKLNYSNSPEKIQTYQEAKATLHLPGLPDVIDPHLTHPAENPLYSLINEQSIKVLFSNPISKEKQTILAEVIASKAGINRTRGDQLSIETTASDFWVNPETVKLIAFGLLGSAVLFALLGLIALGFKNNRKIKLKTLFSKKATQTIKLKTKDAHEVLKVIAKRNPVVASHTSKILDPLEIILNSDPKTTVLTIQNEPAKNLARAMDRASIEFAQIIYRAATPKQRIIIKNHLNILASQKNNNRDHESKFYQLLLASKVQNNTKNGIVNQIETLVSTQELREAEEIKAQESLQSTIQAARATQGEAKENSRESYEVQNASL